MNKKIIYFLIFTIVTLLSSSVVSFQEITANKELRGNIAIEITNFKNNDGYLVIGLYNDAKGFPGTTESMIMSAKVKITEKKASAEFKDIPYGVYAITGYQDENNNGKLDTGLFKIPKEGLIVSNDAKGSMGPAKYEDAKFELKSGQLNLKIRVQFY
jgi:uncharacterized protein (DUF2141 family)